MAQELTAEEQQLQHNALKPNQGVANAEQQMHDNNILQP